MSAPSVLPSQTSSGYRAPVVAVPGQDAGVDAMDEPCLYIAFSAGRRGAGSVDCLVCGTAIHQHLDPDEPGQTDDPTLPWYDGHGDSGDLHPNRHEHEPAHEIGPTFGPFRYAELTYDTCRVDDGETLAVWNSARGDWQLTAVAGEFEGQAYSDATIFPPSGLPAGTRKGGDDRG